MFRCIRESGDREVCAGLRETLGGAVRAGRGGRGPSTHGEPYGRCRGVEAVVRRAIPVGVRPGLRTGRGIVEILPSLDLSRDSRRPATGSAQPLDVDGEPVLAGHGAMADLRPSSSARPSGAERPMHGRGWEFAVEEQWRALSHELAESQPAFISVTPGMRSSSCAAPKPALRARTTR
jgi:hypothetical protein